MFQIWDQHYGLQAKSSPQPVLDGPQTKHGFYIFFEWLKKSKDS